MPTPIAAERIRLKCIEGNDTAATNVLTSQSPLVPRAADIIFEIGLFKDANTIIDTFTDLQSFVLQIRDTATRRTKILEYETLKAAFNSTSISKAQWDENSQVNSHILQKVPGSDLNFDLSGESNNKKSFFVVGYVNWVDGVTARKTVVLKATLEVEEYGIQDTLPALGGAAANFVIRADGTLAIKNLTGTATYRLWVNDSEGVPELRLEQV